MIYLKFFQFQNVLFHLFSIQERLKKIPERAYE